MKLSGYRWRCRARELWVEVRGRWENAPREERGRIAALGAIGCVVFLMAFTVPRRAAILPVGREVNRAFEMLRSSPTGRDLVGAVERSANGAYIYLTLGETERDELVDEYGRAVRGVTRAVTQWGGGAAMVSNVAVVTNRDLTGGLPDEIVKSLAFELENVRYLYETRGRVSSGADSPRAASTQRRVIRELASN